IVCDACALAGIPARVVEKGFCRFRPSRAQIRRRLTAGTWVMCALASRQTAGRHTAVMCLFGSKSTGRLLHGGWTASRVSSRVAAIGLLTRRRAADYLKRLIEQDGQGGSGWNLQLRSR